MEYFTFIDRVFTLQFFREDPIFVECCLGDRLEQQLLEMAERLDAAENAAAAKTALYPLLGRENTEKILARGDNGDIFGARQVGLHLIAACTEEMGKNQKAAGAGRQENTASGTCPTD